MTPPDNKPIPLLDLQAQYNSIANELEAAALGLMRSGQYIMGRTVAQFESDIASYLGVEHALGCASGSDALLLALMALDIGPGDAVITSPFTYFATGGAITRLGAIPIFMDIRPADYNLDPAGVRHFLESSDTRYQALGIRPEQVKAIIPVHLYGQMADIEEFLAISQEFSIPLVEDAAQAIGAEQAFSNGRIVGAGTEGDFGCFSFFPSKNLGALGDGGLITVRNPELAEKVRILRLHGSKPKYYHQMVGINSRLDALQAAILRVKLNYLDSWSAARQEKATVYNELFAKAGLVSEAPHCWDRDCKSVCNWLGKSVVLPTETVACNGGTHIYHQYTIRVKERDTIAKGLTNAGIGNSVYYPLCLHQQECFSDLGYAGFEELCPNAVCAASQALSLPIYPELSKNNQRRVVETIGSLLA
ncbi:MAG: transcriptional regulator [Balneola sp.]|nr:transcriptional regulator [Balneola sp.]|tara:strand:- start:2951 stop:4207 length:1257 start_codon:yes stop_codon:yes gene_type:complete